MKKTVIAGLTALSLFGSPLAYAQQPTPQAQPDQERLRQPNPQAQQEQTRLRRTQGDLAALTDARIALLKTGLRLTPDQEKNWPPVEQAIRQLAQDRHERMVRKISEVKPSDAIARLRERADAMSQTASDLKKLADASEPLYQSLSEEQKRRLPDLIALAKGELPEHRLVGYRRHRRG